MLQLVDGGTLCVVTSGCHGGTPRARLHEAGDDTAACRDADNDTTAVSEVTQADGVDVGRKGKPTEMVVVGVVEEVEEGSEAMAMVVCDAEEEATVHTTQHHVQAAER
ncbi:hypothetical protein B296_00043477 [Ensete ventricosum]|uniref:Uncharacterized protein n=1 Tax=Ensete ventricosum TaxID=4639 RepID=A0A426XM56_ENSVE|nr:hypothetical protein B296_00043477 [Ensete ventricosum]